jgi:N-acetylmuramoyl-L-alanine amidase
MFASYIQTHLKENALRTDRNVRQAGFLILRQITMPGVLIETGYLSNPSERGFLTSIQGKKNLSDAIFNAFKTFKNKIESKSETNLIVEKTELEKDENPKILKDAKDEIIQSKPLKQEANQVAFSVQIMALKKSIEVIPENFKNEANIFVIESLDFNRYFSGRFKTLAEAKNERKRIQNKFSNAFIVAFENNQLISVKKVLGKM